MHQTAVGNQYMLRGMETYHICGRCSSFFADGEHMFLGNVGCIMPNPQNAAERKLFEEWSVERADGGRAFFKRCLRCFLNGQECVALPEDLRGDLDVIEALLFCLRNEYEEIRVPNPNYVDPKAVTRHSGPEGSDDDVLAEISSTAPAPKPAVPLDKSGSNSKPSSRGASGRKAGNPKSGSSRVAKPGDPKNTTDAYIIERRPLSEDALELKAARLVKLCKPIAHRLGRDLIPHSVHLFLHSGAVDDEQDPCSEVRPSGRKRDTLTVNAKAEIKKRSLEATVNASLQEEAENDGTPRKKQRGGKFAVNAQAENMRRKRELEAELSRLKAERESASKNTKATLTRKINAVQRQLDKI